MISITLSLILLTSAVSFLAWNQPVLLSQWSMNPYQVHQKREYYRFLSSGFIHADVFHLFFNMLTLFFFGSRLEQFYVLLYDDWGKVLFLFLYIFGVVLSDIPTYRKHFKHPSYSTLGASGGTAAIVFSCILFEPLANICIYGFVCIPGFILALLYLIYSFSMSRQQYDNINHDAHAYGALLGIIFNFILNPYLIFHFFSQLGKWRGFF